MEIIEKLPPEVSDDETFQAIQTRATTFLNQFETSETSLPASLESSPMEGRPSESSAIRDGSEKEITEQFEPGVYITYVYQNNGGKIFKRVRFRCVLNSSWIHAYIRI